MALWDITDKIWEGEAAFIIGGGPSLKSFDFELLRVRNTIGCNSAFRLGEELCKVLFFGDMLWFERYKLDLLAKYRGKIFSSHPYAIATTLPQFYGLPRNRESLSRAELGWFGNSGASALNLACIFGATTIYLLGFDMDLGPNGENNYHNESVFPVSVEPYIRFRSEFGKLAKQLPYVFPDVSVINLNPDSRLDDFPKQTLDSVFGELEEEV